MEKTLRDKLVPESKLPPRKPERSPFLCNKLQVSLAAAVESLKYIKLKQLLAPRRTSKTAIKVKPESWDDFVAQIRRVAVATQEPRIDTLDWDVLVGRLGHGELRTWIELWRLQSSLRANQTTKTKTSKAAIAIQHHKQVLECLCADQNQNLTQSLFNINRNVKTLTTALDVSASHKATAVLAMNIILKQLNNWCPILVDASDC